MTKPVSRPGSRAERPDRDLPRSLDALEALLLRRVAESTEDPTDALWKLVHFYDRVGRHADALRRLAELLARAAEPADRALLLLTMGQSSEKLGNYEGAAGHYEQARALEPADPWVAYFVHNNLGYCMNELGRFAEAERLCRRAIELDSARANAFKNLGIALQGLGRLADAARAFLDATWTTPRDGRAHALLEQLLEAHPALRETFGAEARSATEIVAAAQGERVH